MGSLIDAGKLRGWGSCNDNAYGLAGMCYAARAVGAPPPCVMQGDYSLINRRSEENGLAEACSPVHENVGWMAYNVLAGGFLTGKYLRQAAAVDERDAPKAEELLRNPRGRMDDFSWGSTLYRYRSSAALAAAAAYSRIAADAGISETELACRWVRQRNFCTTSLLGHTSLEQLEQTLDYFTRDSDLDPQVMAAIDVVHMRNRLPIFSSDRVTLEMALEHAGEIGERIP